MDRVLIADDEPNIRFTLSQALSLLPIAIDTAENGEQAIEKINQDEYRLILLDLRMPGIGGMETLRRLRDDRPEIPVVIITAHGDVGSAVEAMKLGAIEFLPKPFSPEEIQSLVSRILDRHRLTDADVQDYANSFDLAKRCLSERHSDAALEHLKRAIGIDPERPEAINLLGVVHELRGERREARNNYLVAYHTDPTYEPARENLEHGSSGVWRQTKPLNLGELRERQEK